MPEITTTAPPRVRRRMGVPSSYAAALAAGGLVLLVLGLTQRSSLVYTPGVSPIAGVLPVDPDRQACVAPIVPPRIASFDQVRLFAGTGGVPGPPLELTVAPAAGGGALASGRAAGGYRATDEPVSLVVPVRRVSGGRPLVVCIRNVGTARVWLFGAGAIASSPNVSVDGGPPTGSDIAVRLETGHPRSLLALLPDMGGRAALFKASWVSPALLAVLAAALLLAVPALLWVGLRRADD